MLRRCCCQSRSLLQTLPFIHQTAAKCFIHCLVVPAGTTRRCCTMSALAEGLVDTEFTPLVFVMKALRT
jgi:hypothetical protein